MIREMTSELELELTFLAKELPREIKTVKPTRITDIYIPDIPDHSHLRLRQKGERYEITKNYPSQKEMPPSKLNRQYRSQKKSISPCLTVVKNE